MKVICIDKSKLIEPVNTSLLTIGKTYYVEDSSNFFSSFGLVDDTGIYRTYKKSRFIPISEVRKAKLSKIK